MPYAGQGAEQMAGYECILYIPIETR